MKNFFKILSDFLLMGRRGNSYQPIKLLRYRDDDGLTISYPLDKNGKHITDMKRAQRTVYRKKEESTQHTNESIQSSSINYIRYQVNFPVFQSVETQIEIPDQNPLKQLGLDSGIDTNDSSVNESSNASTNENDNVISFPSEDEQSAMFSNQDSDLDYEFIMNF